MTNKKPLSDRQQGIIDFIFEYVEDKRRPPTIREIGKAVDITSTSVVNYNLTKLKERGLLTREKEVSRGLRLTQKALDSLGAAARRSAAAAARLDEALQEIVRIPLVGVIKAGEPIEVGNSDFSTFDSDDAVELGASLLPGKAEELFALRVTGDSMIDASVNDGDIVVMRKAETAENGDMVAVWLTPRDITTLKRFYRENGKIRLQPDNPAYDPMIVDPREVLVQGKVVMVLRQTA